MQKALNSFLEELKQNPNNLAVALFGSHAKGTNRPDSDIDLLVITKNINQRGVEKKHGQEFEIVYATAPDTEAFYKKDPNNYVRFWQHAIILYDPQKILAKFQKKAHAMFKEKKHPMSEDAIKHSIFNLTDQLHYINFQIDKDPANALRMLYSHLYTTLDFYFDYHQIWKPAPKETLQTLDKINPRLAQKARELLLETSINKKGTIFEELIRELGINEL
ncbi:nucleotidyltransferase domain-containing protein [Candidatus Peregrinibacteria bacterium]|nr:nucleotidyltransferase domain-containing protein [Candidatus Peregrinibacteria bacterium]